MDGKWVGRVGRGEWVGEWMGSRLGKERAGMACPSSAMSREGRSRRKKAVTSSEGREGRYRPTESQKGKEFDSTQWKQSKILPSCTL